MPYAAKTSIQVADTRSHIEALLKKHGADRFFYSEEPNRATVGFSIGKMLVKITVPYPQHERPHHEGQAKRSRWRLLFLLIKARFEAIGAGVTTLEHEFLADVVIRDGETVQTVHEWITPQIKRMVDTGRAPRTLMIEGPK